MRQISEFIAAFVRGLFAGAAIYCGIVEHPARMNCGTELAASDFPPSYPEPVSCRRSWRICVWCPP